MGLPRRPFGSTGLEASVLGLGGAWIGLPEPDVSEAQAVETVRRAIDLGVSYVDTSPLYGESERRIGLALSGGRREKVLLSTKTGTRPERRYDYSSDATRWSVDLSLRALRTDVLDVVLIHDPPGRESVFEEGAALDALESLREEGVLRFIGVGVRDHALLAECILSGRFDVVLTYLDYNLISQTAGEKVLPLAQEKGVAVLNGSPFYMGLLADRDPSGFARRRGWPGEE